MSHLLRTSLSPRARGFFLFAVGWGLFCVSLYGDDRARSPKVAVEQLSLYPGLEARLFASEPLIASVTNLDVDERGRVWVCEVQNYRGHGVRNQRPDGDRILILEDTNGDGTADLTKVFYQGRDVDAALGICVFDGRVIVTCAPNVIVFTDENGDDVPDSKSYLFTETGRPQNDHSTHSFVFGPDGRFYWNMGNGGGWVHDQAGRQVYDQFGTAVFDRRAARSKEEYRGRRSPFLGGMVFRCDLEGGEFEVLAHNFRNNYEVTVDSYGGMWQSDNDDDGNYGVRLNYIVEYGNYGYLDEFSGEGWRVPRVSEHDDISLRHWHQNDPGVVPNFVQTGAGSPTGITVYEGDLLPEVFHDQVLHCDAGPGVLWAAIAQDKGAGYEGEIVRMVESKTDKWFRPVDVAVAPDGSLFLSDWYDPVVGWNRQADLSRGRILRIAPAGHSYSVPGFDFSTPEGACLALQNPSYSVRARAWLSLRGMGNDSTESLLGLAQHSNPRFRARAYWLLAANPESWDETVERILIDSDPNIRKLALRAGARYGYPLIPVIDRLVGDLSSAVLRECAVSLRRLPTDLAVPLWVRLIERFDGEDRWFLEALGIGAEGRWDECLNAWLSGPMVSYDSLAVRRILWRSRSVSTPGHLSRMLQRVDLPLNEIPGLLRAFDFQNDSGEKGVQLLTLLRSKVLAGDSPEQDLIRIEALRRLAKLRSDEEPLIRENALRLAAVIANPQQKVALIREFGLREMRETLVDFIGGGSLDLGTEAMRALIELGGMAMISEKIATSHETEEHLVSMLARTKMGAAVPLLLRILKSDSHAQNVREMALRGLIDGREGISEVFGLARSGKFPGELREAAGKAFSKSLHVLNRKAAAELFPVPALENSEPLPGMTELLVYVGDVENGRRVFENATCSQCHIVGDLGQAYGPELSSIGTKLAKQGIYEAILDPSASVSPSYRGVEMVLTSGEEREGLLVSESDEVIIVNQQGKGLQRIERSNISEMRILAQSVMPSGLQQLMSLNELVDLVEFLSQARQ